MPPYLLTGSGRPVTVFAHGLGGSIPDTRPLGSGVHGTRCFLTFGASDYPALADELRSVADEVGATRALGVSMGAGALLRLLAATPDRFDRVVFYLPAVLDERRRTAAMDRRLAWADLADAGDVDALTSSLLEELPERVRARPEAVVFARRQAGVLTGPAASKALRVLPVSAPLDDLAALRKVEVPVLVLAQREDEAHPVEVAEQLASVLPNARLHVFDAPAAVWTARSELRAQVAGFLNA